MEKDRSRGLKHIKDKRKYKGNSIKNPKHVPPKSKPSLDSNWDRYEIAEEHENEHNLSSSTDFALLSNAPISAGSHFQFKSDKINEENDQEENTLFSLNLDLLNKSISTIPFYERLGIGKEYFQDHEIKHMDGNAVKYLLSYQNFIKNHHIMHISPGIKETKPGGVLPVHDTSISQELEHVIEKIENVICDEKDNVFHLIENCLIEDNTDVKPSVDLEPNDDLEQWLDDILED